MTEVTRRKLTNAEGYYMWAACGGICSFEGCNKRLIESMDGVLTNVGEKAHIIGHKEKAPRHEYMEQYGYTQETLEDISNLMLMCSDHHKQIDNHILKNKFTPDILFEMKRKHEEMVASWSNSRKKKSIALIHKRLGGPILDIEYEGDPPHILIDAVSDQEPFTDYTEEGWKDGISRNADMYSRLLQKISEKDARVAEIYPLSPIPLLIHLGSLLTDTVSYIVYQYDRDKGVWVYKNNSMENKDIEIEAIKEVNNFKELVVTISISGVVKDIDVKNTLNYDCDIISFKINNPGVKRILYNEDVKFISSRIKEEIEKLLQENAYEKIHLFFAGPAGLAVEIGRGINKNIWSEVLVYQYSIREENKYSYALTI